MFCGLLSCCSLCKRHDSIKLFIPRFYIQVSCVSVSVHFPEASLSNFSLCSRVSDDLLKFRKTVITIYEISIRCSSHAGASQVRRLSATRVVKRPAHRKAATEKGCRRGYTRVARLLMCPRNGLWDLPRGSGEP